MYIVSRGTIQTLTLCVVDNLVPANNPVVGQVVTVAIRRLSDDKWYDFIAATWDTFASYALIESSNKQLLTDKGDGCYEFDFDQETIDGGVSRDYLMVYENGLGDYQGMSYEHWSFIEGTTLTSTERAAVADAVADEEFLSATVDDTTLRGAALAAWTQGFGRWALDGVTLRLYAPDGLTVVRTFTLDDETNPTLRTPS